MSPLPTNLEEATALIIDRARELLSRLYLSTEQEKPPFSVEELARLQGIKSIEKTDLGEQDAVLLKLQHGYILKVNRTHHSVRQRFSCAHEIGHTLLHELEQKACAGSADFRMAVTQVNGHRKERLCEAAAAELLMPESVFREYLSRFGLSVNSIERMASLFWVSIRAAAIRIAEVSAEPCIAILWQPWMRRKSEGLRIAWCTGPGRRSNSRERYTPVSTYVSDPAALLKAYQEDSIVKSFKVFELGKFRKRCYMESKGFGRDKTRYVISLAFPDR